MELDAQTFARACREGGRLIERWLREFDRHHGPALYREAASVLRNWHLAEDVVQDTLIKVWQRCATFRSETSPQVWIRRVLRNALLDVLRLRQYEEPLEIDGVLSPCVEAAVSRQSREVVRQPDELLDQHVLQGIYQRCWARFALAHPEHAAVLRWVIEDGMTPADLSALLDRSPGATREYISQCRKKARPFLDEWRQLVGPGPTQD